MSVSSPQTASVEASSRRLPYPFPKTHSTQLYEQVVREADGANSRLYPAARDGQASRGELEAYRQNLDQQIQFFQFLKQFFGPVFGKSIDGYLEHLRDKSDVTDTMLRNFNTFDSAGRKDGRISQNEVRTVAGRDGNPHDVSWRDLLTFHALPILPPPRDLLFTAEAEGVAGTAGSMDGNIDPSTPTEAAL